MTNFQPLIDSVNKQTNAVESKMSDIDKRVEAAEQEFNKFEETADSRYMTRTGISVFVAGDADKFYPVYIPAVHSGIAVLQISRSVHDNILWAGAMSAQFLLQNNSWGGYPSFLVMDAFGHAFHGADTTPADVKTDGFIADYVNGVIYVTGAIFWLRGNHSYRVSSSLKNIENVVTHDDLVTTPSFNNDIHVFKSGYDITSSGYRAVASIKTARNTVKIPTLSYVRGVS